MIYCHEPMKKIVKKKYAKFFKLPMKCVYIHVYTHNVDLKN